MASFFQINGVDLPYPKYGLNESFVQLVDSGRNALGQIVSQKIGRRQFKYENLVWPHLTAAEWSAILQEIEKFEGELTYYDALSQSIITRKIYWGDAKAEIWKIDDETKLPIEYINCSANPIDMGYDNL